MPAVLLVQCLSTSSAAQGAGRSFKDRKVIYRRLVSVNHDGKAKPLMDREVVGGSAV